MRLLGQLAHGINSDDCDNIPIQLIHEHYGVFGPQANRQPGQTGAGHPSDEGDSGTLDEASDNFEGEEWMDEEVEEQLGGVQRALDETVPNIRHAPVPVPDSGNPFSDAEATAFYEVLQQAQERKWIPEGYGLNEREWERGEYPSIEVIPAGRRASKELRIGLPDDIWRPRAHTWGRALYLMNHIFFCRRMDIDVEI